MKKLMILAVVMAGMTLLADDASTYLYFMVNPAHDGWSERPFDAAYLRVTDQGGNMLVDGNGNPVRAGIYVEDYGLAQGFGPETDGGYSTQPMFADISDYASDMYGFVVEAYLSGGDSPAWVGTVGYYDQLLANNHIWSGSPSAMSGNVTPWSTQVPEPTSGLLFLLGLASLALRRKRVEVEV